MLPSSSSSSSSSSSCWSVQVRVRVQLLLLSKLVAMTLYLLLLLLAVTPPMTITTVVIADDADATLTSSSTFEALLRPSLTPTVSPTLSGRPSYNPTTTHEPTNIPSDPPSDRPSLSIRSRSMLHFAQKIIGNNGKNFTTDQLGRIEVVYRGNTKLFAPSDVTDPDENINTTCTIIDQLLSTSTGNGSGLTVVSNLSDFIIIDDTDASSNTNTTTKDDSTTPKFITIVFKMAYDSDYYNVTNYTTLFHSWTNSNITYVTKQLNTINLNITSLGNVSLINLVTAEPSQVPSSMPSYTPTTKIPTPTVISDSNWSEIVIAIAVLVALCILGYGVFIYCKQRKQRRELIQRRVQEEDERRKQQQQQQATRKKSDTSSQNISSKQYDYAGSTGTTTNTSGGFVDGVIPHSSIAETTEETKTRDKRRKSTNDNNNRRPSGRRSSVASVAAAAKLSSEMIRAYGLLDSSSDLEIGHGGGNNTNAVSDTVSKQSIESSDNEEYTATTATPTSVLSPQQQHNMFVPSASIDDTHDSIVDDLDLYMTKSDIVNQQKKKKATAAVATMKDRVAESNDAVTRNNDTIHDDNLGQSLRTSLIRKETIARAFMESEERTTIGTFSDILWGGEETITSSEIEASALRITLDWLKYNTQASSQEK